MNAKLDQEIASASLTTTTDQCGATCDGRNPVRLCAPVDGAKGLRELVERVLSLPPVPVLVHGRLGRLRVGAPYAGSMKTLSAWVARARRS